MSLSTQTPILEPHFFYVGSYEFTISILDFRSDVSINLKSECARIYSRIEPMIIFRVRNEDLVFHETTQIFLELLETAGCTISGKSTDTDGYAPAPCTVSHVKGNRVLSTRSCIFSEPNQNNEKHIVEATGTTLEFTKNEYIIMIEAMCLKFTKEQYFEFCHKLIDIVEKPPLEHDFGRFYWS